MNVGIVAAIGREEGAAIKGDRAFRNNNPGNINFVPWTKQYFGATLETAIDPRFAKFPSMAIGYNALHYLLATQYKGYTIEQLIHKYAPSNENDTQQYVKNICTFTGLTPNTVIDNYL